MSALRNVEDRIGGFVERVFGRLFRGHVEPVELARKLAREMEDHKTVSVSRVYVPNEYVVYLSASDRERVASFEGALTTELGVYLSERARHEGFTLLSEPRIRLETDTDLRLGEYGIACRVVDPPAEVVEPQEVDASTPEPVIPPPFPPAAATVPEPPDGAGDASADDQADEPEVPADDALSDEGAPAVAAAVGDGVAAADDATPDDEVPAAPIETPVDEPPPAVVEANDVPAPEIAASTPPPPMLDEAPSTPELADDEPVATPPVPVAETGLPPTTAPPAPVVEAELPPPPVPMVEVEQPAAADPIPPAAVEPPAVPPVPTLPPVEPAVEPPAVVLPPPGGYEPLAGVSGTQIMSPEEARAQGLVHEEMALLIDGRRHVVAKRSTTLGRSRDCDVVVQDANASRNHAEIRHIGLDYFIVDSGSTNGTLVNGQRIRRHALAHGDRILIGTTEIVVEHTA